jgi:hypothetical protein
MKFVFKNCPWKLKATLSPAAVPGTHIGGTRRPVLAIDRRRHNLKA